VPIRFSNVYSIAISRNSGRPATKPINARDRTANVAVELTARTLSNIVGPIIALTIAKTRLIKTAIRATVNIMRMKDPQI